MAEANRIVAELDRLSLARQRPITRPAAAEVLARLQQSAEPEQNEED